MATYTSKVYECSRANSVVQEGNNVWVNSFSDPIDLEPGDQVRILGSFVNESSGGSSIEIADGFNQVNINFMPFIKGRTFATSDKQDDLMTLGDIGRPAYCTDGFGIEPPTAYDLASNVNPNAIPIPPATTVKSSYIKKYVNTDPTSGTGGGGDDSYDTFVDVSKLAGITGSSPAAPYKQTSLALNLPHMYYDPDYTCRPRVMLNYGTPAAWYFTDFNEFATLSTEYSSDSAEVAGTNIITSSYGDPDHSYKSFAHSTVPNDFYISTMCKKLVLPVLNNFRTGLRNFNNVLEIDPLLYNVPVAGIPGSFNGCPKPGMFICTVDIGTTTGWYDNNNISYIEATNPRGLGFPNLKSGPQSVVGKILAVRPIKTMLHNSWSTTGKHLNEVHCFEIYVYDCFIPAQKNKSIRHTFTENNSILDGINHWVPNPVAENTPPFTRENPQIYPKTCKRLVHGASELEDGWSANPSFNNINGPVYNPRVFGRTSDYPSATVPPTNPTEAHQLGNAYGMHGQSEAMPTPFTYFDNKAKLITNPPPAFASSNGPVSNGAQAMRGEDTFDIGSPQDRKQTSHFDYGLFNPQGISYFWTGSHVGTLRYPSMLKTDPTVAGGDPQVIIQELKRCNTYSYIGKADGTAGPQVDLIDWGLRIDNGTSQSEFNDYGAYVQYGLNETLNQQNIGALMIMNGDEMDNLINGYYSTNELNCIGTTVTATLNGDALAGATTITVVSTVNITLTSYLAIGTAGNLTVKNVTNLTPTIITLSGPLDDQIDDLTVLNFQDQTNFVPRVWTTLSKQLLESDYSERHYRRNNWITNTAVDSDICTQDAFDQSGFNPGGITYDNGSNFEKRFDISHAGQPLSWNWRDAYGLNKSFQIKLVNTNIYNLHYDELNLGNIENLGPNTGQASRGGDGMPVYLSTANGHDDSIDWNNPPLSGNTDNSYAGFPYNFGGYNNSCNSVYFQDQASGDTKLNRLGNQYITTIENNIGATGGVYILPLADYPTTWVPKVGDYVNFLNVPSNLFKIQTIVVGAAVTVTITPNPHIPPWNYATGSVGDAFIISDVGNNNGMGTNALEWSSDMLCIQENVMKLQVRAGFYSPQHIAEEFDDIFHASTQDYKTKYGTKNTTNGQWSVPSNVGIRQQAPSSEPTVVRGNFVHTYIPDLSYGFIPVTNDNANDIQQTASTKEYSILTYDTYDPDTGNWTYYNQYTIANELNGLDVTTMTNTPCGKHIKFYAVPHLEKEENVGADNSQIHLFGLKGGRLATTDYNPTAGPPQWINRSSSLQGWEMLRSAWLGAEEVPAVNAGPPITLSGNTCSYGWAPQCSMSACWQTRWCRNLMLNGGGARIFAGANNATFQYNEDQDRMEFTNLYTPFRPHNSENPSSTDFSVGDAIPSVVIDARRTGAIIDDLCGIYITNLNTDAITPSNYGTDYFNNIVYDNITTDLNQKAIGKIFLNQLGFSDNQITNFSNSLDLKNPYTFYNRELTSGATLRNLAKVNTSINASNPFVSNCLNILPVAQYMAQVDSDVVQAENTSIRGTDPFYLVGSDFPNSQFFGSTEGQHLPVIGICSRNFSAFNFVFDLGGSSITYTIDQKVSIKSIKTALYNSRLQDPNNINEYSSVIYLVTKAKYVNQITQPELQQQIAEILVQQKTAPMMGAFYNPSQASYRVGIPPNLTPKQQKEYYESEGSIYPSDETTTEWSDSD